MNYKKYKQLEIFSLFILLWILAGKYFFQIFFSYQFSLLEKIVINSLICPWDIISFLVLICDDEELCLGNIKQLKIKINLRNKQ